MKLRSWLGAALLAVVSVLGLAVPATAAGHLQLSSNGVTWGNNLSAPLFDPVFRWVPGDSQTASFYIRNQTGQDAVLDLIMLPAQYGDLMKSGDLTVSGQVDGGTWVGATSADNSHFLITSAPVPGKAVRKINIRIDFAGSSSNATQNRQVGLAFDVALTQAKAIVLAPTQGGGHGSGAGGKNPNSLPNTGNDVSPLMILLAVLLCAGGAALAVLSQRDGTKERETSHA